MLWNGLFWLHKSRKTGLHKTSPFSLSVLCRKWSEHPRSEGEWSLEMRQPGVLMEPLGVQGPWWGARWAPVALPARWLEVTSQHTDPLQVTQGGLFPGQPSQDLQVPGSPPTPPPLKASQHLSLYVKRNRSEEKRVMELREGISGLRSRGCSVCVWCRASHCNGISCSVTVF